MCRLHHEPKTDNLQRMRSCVEVLPSEWLWRLSKDERRCGHDESCKQHFILVRLRRLIFSEEAEQVTAFLRAVEHIRQQEIDRISVCVRLAPLLLDASTVSRDNLASERRLIATLYVSMDNMGKLVQRDKKELQPK